MERTTRAFLVACCLAVAGPMAVPSAAGAVSSDDAQREVSRLVDELDRLHEQADILAEDYVVAIDDLRRLEEEVAAAELSVAAKEAELNELRGDLSEVAVRAFTGSGGDVLGPLFNDASSYNDELQRDQYSRIALSVGTVTTDDLDQLITDLDEERADLAAKREQAEQLTVTIEEKQRATEELTAEYKRRRAEAEAVYQTALAEEEQRRAEEAYRRLQEEAAAAAAAQQASQSGNTGGGGGGGGGGTAPAPAPAPSSGSGSGSGGGSSTPAAPAPAAPAPSSLASVAVNAALSQQGVPYRYATSNPGVSFDCSGLTKYAWGQAGVALPHQSRAQAAMLPRVSASQAQPGDLIFYYSPISHVGVYLGGGALVHAPNTGSFVSITSVNWSKVTAVGRPG